MTLSCERPPAGAADGPLECQLLAGVDVQEINQNRPTPQDNLLRNPRAVREATIASILDQSHWLLGSLMLQASIAQQFADLGDARGFLYSLDQVVKQAISAGAEGVELRKIRKEMREARASDR